MTEPSRQLPPHIQAALAGAGGVSDSAGQPWAGRELSGVHSYHNFGDDDGSADVGLTAARAALRAGTGSERNVVAALAGARVYVPIVAEVADTGVLPNGLTTDKESDMALLTLTAPDGRRALPVFSSTESLQRWHPQARPVAVRADRAALSAVAEEAQLLVLDPGAESTFVIRRPAVWALARQEPWLPSYADPEVLAELSSAAEFPEAAAVVTITAGPGSGIASRTADGAVLAGGGTGPELQIMLGLRPGLDQEQLDRLVAGLQQRWSGKKLVAERVDSMEIFLRPAEQ